MSRRELASCGTIKKTVTGGLDLATFNGELGCGNGCDNAG